MMHLRKHESMEILKCFNFKIIAQVDRENKNGFRKKLSTLQHAATFYMIILGTEKYGYFLF